MITEMKQWTICIFAVSSLVQLYADSQAGKVPVWDRDRQISNFSSGTASPVLSG